MWPNMQHNNFTNLISHKHIRSIKIMIRHMRNMRRISMRVRNIVSGLDALLILLLDIDFSELDEFLTFCVHPNIMLVTGLIANFTLDVRSSHIQICTSCILKLLFFNGLLLLFERLSFVGWLRSLLSDI
jgi:hypothetical protein